MKLVILCDSNIGYHAFKTNEDAKRYLQCDTQIIKSSTISSFEEFVNDLPECDLLIVATVLNQVSNLEAKWSGQFDSSKMADIVSLIEGMCFTINSYAEKHPNTTVWIMPAFSRTSPGWIESAISDINQAYEEFLSGDKVGLLEPPPIDNNDLSVDGVHLHAHGLNKLKNYLKLTTSTFCQKQQSSRQENSVSENHRKRQRQEEDNVEKSSSPTSLSVDAKLDLLLANNAEFLSKCARMEDEIKSLNKQVERIESGYNNSIIAYARESEEKDEARNFNRRNYIVVRNLAIPSGWDISLSGTDKVNAISKLISDELSKSQRVSKSEINVSAVFVLPIVVENHIFSPIRLTCESSADAIEARRRILNMTNTQNSIWSGVDVQNDPVKATRVRLHLMHSMAKSLRSDEYNVVVIRYSDSPTMIVKKERSSSGQLTFVDAILKYGDRLTTNDIEKARNICGRDFIGRRERMFLVIKELEVTQLIPTPIQSDEASTPITNRSFRGSSRGRIMSNFRGRGRGRGSSRGFFNNTGFSSSYPANSSVSLNSSSFVSNQNQNQNQNYNQNIPTQNYQQQACSSSSTFPQNIIHNQNQQQPSLQVQTSNFAQLPSYVPAVQVPSIQVPSTQVPHLQATQNALVHSFPTSNNSHQF